MRNDEKDFDGWMRVKEKLHNARAIRSIHIGDIWWYAAGENVQTEINGKNKAFSRPVMIIKKFGKYSFWGVPLTSQEHEGSWYVKFIFRGKSQIAVLHQLRNIDVARLYNRIGRVPDFDLKMVIDGVKHLLTEE